MRTRVVGRNWKICKDPAGTTSLFESFRPLIERAENCEIIICPSFLDVETAVTAARGTRIKIGALHIGGVVFGAVFGRLLVDRRLITEQEWRE